MLLSGGEPFLRKDLVELAIFLDRKFRPEIISIPSNGFSSDLITKNLKDILGNVSSKVALNISLDGGKEVHNEIRGVSWAYKEAVETLEETIKLRDKYRGKFFLRIHSVISGYNWDKIVPFFQKVKESWNVDLHSFEILRGLPENPDSNIPGDIPLERIVIQLLKEQRYYLHNFWDLSERYILYMNQLRGYYGKKWLYPCLAGKKILVLEPDARLRLCELKPPVADLKKQNWCEIVSSGVFKKAIDDNYKCSCSHGCFAGYSQKYYLKNRKWLHFLAYFNLRFIKRW